MTIKQLPPAEKNSIRLGYMQLTDSVPLIVAKEMGLFSEQGLDVELVREISWANIRDRLVLGNLDAAQLLSPLPMMTAYGLGGIRANILTGLVLSLNGNAITVSSKLWGELGQSNKEQADDPAALSRKLNVLISQQNKKPALTFATVHLFSMHTILLRMWLQAGGIDPDRDVKIIVLPPAQMCDSLARGIIDGFCVGEPWNTLAVNQGVGSVASSGYQLWNNVPEKVLGVTESWHRHHPGTHLRLRIALLKACQYLAQQEHRVEALSFLGKAEYLNMPEHLLAPSLLGEFKYSKNMQAVPFDNFHVFWKFEACFPWRSMAEKMVKLSNFALAKPIADSDIKSLVQACYRTDLYRDAASYFGIASSSKDDKPEGTHNEAWLFEPGIMLGPDKILG